ncbi:MAG TPA: MFS transporter [Gaiellaceae bacterium]|nr:MFS transporter [Gaiellaceae bacterium]
MESDRVLTKPFVLAVLAEFALCMSIGMLLVILPVYANDELGAGSFGVALTVAAVSPMLLLFQPVAGRIGDRKGRRVLIVAGALVAGVSVALYALSDSLGTLIAFRLFTGVGEAMLLVGAATMVTDIAPAKRRGEALSLYSLGLWGGLALGPILGELVLREDHFDSVWLLAAAFCLVSAAIGLALPETRPVRAVGEAFAPSRLVHPAAIGPGLVLALTVLGFAGLGTFAALYARELGMDGAGPVFLVFSAVVVATRIVGRQIPDRLGPKRTSGTALVLISAGLLTIGIWNAPAGLYAGTVVLAFGQALAFPALMTLAVNSAPANERSSVVGTFTAFTELGFAIGALSLGVVASAVGYDGVFIVCAVGPLLGALLLARIAGPRTAPALDPA